MKKAGDILKELLGSLKISGKEEENIFSSWEKIAGKEIAEHSRITDLRKEILFIEADHPGWVQIIDLKKKQFVKKINILFPGKGIEDLKISLRKTRNS